MTDEFNTGDYEGVELYQVTQFHDPAKNGVRCSSAAGFLFPALSRPNLTGITQAQATQLTFDDRRATGVIYQHEGQVLSVSVKQEVLLCAGAFQSPQLLQLSGIEDGEALNQ
ncbi:GMC family oxidoreductase N-terminal domain-containing protein [Roseovarius sp. EL26]|uniref:GMC family oxidoreductase N-terminal domain-containing protein n=1 Tax=Roseovarius sp. EL26 TaxID=2126672 RepID=UPI0020B160A6|nr:GMC family oxidoreductase N-terminal domain-containing protein [Roseovarius sp. EL26]